MNPFKKSSEILPDFEYFTIYDTKAGLYREPVLAVNRLDIVRQIENLFRDPKQEQNVLVTNPEDFQLFKIGDFTKKTAKINWHEPEHIVSFHEVKSSLMRDQAAGH